MMLWCAKCKGMSSRESFIVKRAARTLLFDGKPVAYLVHRRCHWQTIVLAGSIIARAEPAAR